MKKLFLFVLLVILFSYSPKPSASNFSYRWWTFTGASQLEMYDQNNYYLDEDQIPDCPPNSGTIYCCIYTTIDPNSPFGNPLPDMAGIILRRYRE